MRNSLYTVVAIRHDHFPNGKVNYIDEGPIKSYSSRDDAYKDAVAAAKSEIKELDIGYDPDNVTFEIPEDHEYQSKQRVTVCKYYHKLDENGEILDVIGTTEKVTERVIIEVHY